MGKPGYDIIEAAVIICVEKIGQFNRNSEVWWWNETVDLHQKITTSRKEGSI